MTIYSLDVLLSQFGTSLLFHVWFQLLLLDLHTDFSGGRWGGLVFPSLEEFLHGLLCSTVKALAWAASTFRRLWLALLWAFVNGLLCGCVFTSLGWTPGTQIAGSHANTMFKFLRNFQAVFPSGCRFYIPTSRDQGVQFLSKTCCCSRAILRGVKSCLSHCALGCSLTSGTGHLYMCLLALSSSEKPLFRSFVVFLKYYVVV